MTGLDNDDDGPEEFRPVPHPDDRLWRHPSEIAAMQAAHANAETAQVPVVSLSDPAPSSRLNAGLKLAAGLVVVGAGALTIGIVSSQGSSPTVETSNAAPLMVALSPGNPLSTERQEPVATEFTAEDSSQGEALLAARVHDQVAASLPRITAVTSAGMREGSGMFVTDNGHIVTSAGLIDSAEYVLAWTEDGQRWKAHLVATDPVSDIAVIQIESIDWPSVSLDAGADLRDGQYALALDHDHDSIAIGEVISVTSPLLEVEQSVAVPGSAIIDDSGAVIAMIIGNGTNRHGARAWMLEQVTVDLITSGRTAHNWLGLVVSHEAATDMVVVTSVVEGSPAARAGLRNGDLIDSFDGDPIVDAASLHRQLQNAEPGEDAVLTVTRDGSRRTIVATVTELDPQE
ncbi:MAG: S1C family serine protease [Acidimicrobiales bacterium]|nr:S1C family serine protease [Acidimicrobiales bacterium]